MRLDQLTEVLLDIHGLINNGGASRNNGRSIRRRHKLADACTAGDSCTGDSGRTTAAASPGGADAQMFSPSRETSQDDIPLVEGLPPRQVRNAEYFSNTTDATNAPPKASNVMANAIDTTPLSPEAVQLLPVVHVLAVTAAQVADSREPGRAMPPPLVQPPAASALESTDSSGNEAPAVAMGLNTNVEAEATPMQSRDSLPWRRTLLHGVVPA